MCSKHYIINPTTHTHTYSWAVKHWKWLRSICTRIHLNTPQQSVETCSDVILHADGQSRKFEDNFLKPSCKHDEELYSTKLVELFPLPVLGRHLEYSLNKWALAPLPHTVEMTPRRESFGLAITVTFDLSSENLYSKGHWRVDYGDSPTMYKDIASRGTARC